jgi:TonB family protein
MSTTLSVNRLPETANDRLKRSFRPWLWNSLVAATIAHTGILFFWPELQAAADEFDMREITAIEMPPEITLPSPPEQITRPANPVVSSAQIDENITIAVTTTEEYLNTPLPAPRIRESVDLSNEPYFTPMEVAPDIRNRDAFRRILQAAYPAMLRDARIGGEVRLHFFINAEGIVETARVAVSSGQTQLDEAALRVAPQIEFTPALNRGERVAVWVEIPIRFEPE